MQVTLYRGIAVKPEEADSICERIFAQGISADGGKESKPPWHHIPESNLGSLREKENLSFKDLKNSSICSYPVFRACGDELGASYYAVKHNYSEDRGYTHPLLIKFTTDIKNIRVDQSHFLGMTFSSGMGMLDTGSQKELVEKLFGNQIRIYRDLFGKGRHRAALCELATQDPEVVAAHLENRTVLRGRKGKTSASSFDVRSPLAAENIVSISEPRVKTFNAQVTLRGLHDLPREEL